MCVGSLVLFKTLANNQKENIGRKKTNIRDLVLLKNLQTTRKQTREEKKKHDVIVH
jgi:hypothetical protein